MQSQKHINKKVKTANHWLLFPSQHDFISYAIEGYFSFGLIGGVVLNSRDAANRRPCRT